MFFPPWLALADVDSFHQDLFSPQAADELSAVLLLKPLKSFPSSLKKEKKSIWLFDSQ